MFYHPAYPDPLCIAFKHIKTDSGYYLALSVLMYAVLLF